MNWMEVNRKKIIDWLTLNIFELKKKSQYYSVRWLIKWFCVGFCFVAVAELTIPNFIQLQSILLSFFFVILKYLKHQVINYQTFFFYLHFFQYRLVVICWDSIGCRVLFSYLFFFLLLATRSNGTTWAYSNNKMNSAKHGESIIYIYSHQLWCGFWEENIDQHFVHIFAALRCTANKIVSFRHACESLCLLEFSLSK